jgi:hypothetical protein
MKIGIIFCLLSALFVIILAETKLPFSQALAKAKQEFKNINGVVGIGRTRIGALRIPAIKVLINEKYEDGSLPSVYYGNLVVFDNVGKISIQSDKADACNQCKSRCAAFKSLGTVQKCFGVCENTVCAGTKLSLSDAPICEFPVMKCINANNAHIYTGSFDGCRIDCLNLAKYSFCEGKLLKMSYFPRGTFSSGGCSCCGNA